jgi:hypothetical protein
MALVASENEINWNELDAATFYRMFLTEEAAFQLADDLGLLFRQANCECGMLMERQQQKKAAHGIIFACTNQRGVCRKTRTILAGSWFENSHLSV